MPLHWRNVIRYYHDCVIAGTGISETYAHLQLFISPRKVPDFGGDGGHKADAAIPSRQMVATRRAGSGHLGAGVMPAMLQKRGIRFRRDL